jgi:hypothetical protein
VTAMKAPAMLIGIALIVLGLIALVYQGITYTTSEKVVDLGPLKITAQKEKTIPLPPILGGLALAGGIVLVVVAGRKSKS